MADPTSPDQPEADPTQPIDSVPAPAAEPTQAIPAAPTAQQDPAVAATAPEPPATPVATGGPQPAIITARPRGPRFVGARRLWGEATASAGARVATIVALALATVVVLGGLTAAAVAVSRHGDDGPRQIERGQWTGPEGGNGFGPQGRGDGQGRQGQGPVAPNGPGTGQRLPGQGGPLGGGQRGPGAAGSLHGEFTQGQPATTYLFQRGTVTASSATSVSVKSSDGFTATYAVSDSTRVRGARGATVTVGSEVMVIAAKQGSAAVQIRVIPAGVGVAPNGTT